jgi:Calcineurin-like phosphoesterase
MTVPVYSSHTSALSLWQSAMHTVLSQKPEQQDSTHRGIGVTAMVPAMLATAQVMKHFDLTGNFEVAAPPATPEGAGAAMAAVAGNIAQAEAAPPAPPPSVELECAKLAAQIALYLVTDPDKAAQLRQELTAGTCDPLWAECLLEYERARCEGQIYIDYQNIGNFVMEQCFPDNATIAVIGDWGTGMNDALVLLEQIGKYFQPDVLLHLGDIYYSCLPSECSEHFTALIDKVWPDSGPKPKPLVFTLDGNHDRYAGPNGGYYDLIKSLNQAAGKPQPNSYFTFRNNFWQFVAMDTGYYDSDPSATASGTSVTRLKDEEIPWHLDKIRNNGANVDKTANPTGARGTVLLSHHQLYSFTGIGKNASGAQMAVNQNLVNALSPVFNLIDLWVWGHEHALCIFEPYSNGPGQPLPKGRCVGGSAVPMYLAQKPVAPANLVVPPGADGPPKIIDGTMLGDNGTVFNYCYAIMKLAGPKLSIDYYQVDSTDYQPGNPPPLAEPLYSESIDKPLAAG